jgi:hypothetical protein
MVKLFSLDHSDIRENVEKSGRNQRCGAAQWAGTHMLSHPKLIQRGYDRR